MQERGIWVELTTLFIPGLNDDRRDLRAMAEWIATAVGPETPWHLTCFQPAYRLSRLAETPAATLVDAARIAREVGLRHVYVGNAPEVEFAATTCSRCGERLIGRSGFAVTEWHLVEGRCPRCKHSLAGVGLEDLPGRRTDRQRRSAGAAWRIGLGEPTRARRAVLGTFWSTPAGRSAGGNYSARV